MIHLLALKVVACDSCKGGYPSTAWQVDKIVAFLQRREVFGYLDEEAIGALVAAAWHGWQSGGSGGRVAGNRAIASAGNKPMPPPDRPNKRIRQNERHVIEKKSESSRW